MSMAAVAIGPFGSSIDGRRARRQLSHEGSQEGYQNEIDGTCSLRSSTGACTTS